MTLPQKVLAKELSLAVLVHCLKSYKGIPFKKTEVYIQDIVNQNSSSPDDLRKVQEKLPLHTD